MESPHLVARGPRVTLHVTSAEVTSLSAAAGKVLEVEALIDTGSGRSLIHRDVAAFLGLEPVGKVELDSVTSADVSAPEFAVRIWFDGSLGIPVRALSTPLPVPRLRAVVGRDALAHLRFQYDGPRAKFTLTG